MKPLYMEAVRRIARERGVTPEDVLAEDRRRAQNPEWPKENCLTLLEAEELILRDAGKKVTLGAKELEEVAAHAKICIFCSTVVESMRDNTLRNEP